jgi:hypothetical protein
MNHYNKKYNLNEGRVIGNNIINYGGFPKSINENINLDNLQQSEIIEPKEVSSKDAPTLNKTNSNTPMPVPPGNLPPGRMPSISSPGWDLWYRQWQRMNPPPQPIPGETPAQFHERVRAYNELMRQFGTWRQQWYLWSINH